MSAQFRQEFHAQVVALSNCCQMISQHVRTRVHTGMDAGSVFLKVVPFSTRKMSAYAPKFAIFHEKSASFWSKIEIFGFRQAVEDPPHYFEGAESERAGCRGRQITKTPIYRICMHKNLPFFIKKSPKMQVLYFSRWSPSPQGRCLRMHQNLPFFMKNRPFFGQKLSFLASDKHLKTPPLF